jgi:hypothetical protein
MTGTAALRDLRLAEKQARLHCGWSWGSRPPVPGDADQAHNIQGLDGLEGPVDPLRIGYPFNDLRSDKPRGWQNRMWLKAE